MADMLKRETVTGPLGTFDVSTIRTFSGGGEDFKPTLSPFADSDYAGQTPWAL